MSAITLTGAKNAPKTAFDAFGCADALEMTLQAAEGVNLPPRGRFLMTQRLADQLWREARALTERFNAAVGADALYLAEYAGVWVLYGRPDEEAADKRLLWGVRSVEDLARLVMKLENGMEVTV